MEIERIFKNLLLVDFGILVLIVFSTTYQPNEFSEIYNYLDQGVLSNYKNYVSILSIVLFFVKKNKNFFFIRLIP